MKFIDPRGFIPSFAFQEKFLKILTTLNFSKVFEKVSENALSVDHREIF